jgi:aminodeoxyfutalosine synthase
MAHRRFDDISKKVQDGERLTAVDGEFLYRDDVDLHAVGELADLVRRRKNGDVVYYNLNLHVSTTNVCIYQCSLCAYSRESDDPTAYVMSGDQILAAGREADENGCTELHIVGGLHPDKGYDWYRGILDSLHGAYPRLHLKAWTATEIDRFSQLTRRPARAVLEDLMRVGLGSLPGGGAEIFDPQVRSEICPRKVDGRTWLAIHRAAHQLGLRSNATMLYGHIENVEHRIDHLIALRQLQDSTGGFLAFVPLPFLPKNTRFSHFEKPSPLVDLRTMAISRLMLDNVDHIKAYWVSLGVGTAQTALAYGADDIDGTVRHELIYHEAGAESPQMLTVDAIRQLIAEAGREPVERDTLYRRVKRNGVKWEVEP